MTGRVWYWSLLSLIKLCPFDSAATAHPEQAERVEGWRRGFAQGEHRYWKLKDPSTESLEEPKFEEDVGDEWNTI